MKKPKKSLIITIISAATAIVMAAVAVFMYPYVVERKVGDILDDDFSDVVKVELRSGRSFRKVETSDPDEIKYIIDSISDIKVKKSFDHGLKVGWSLNIGLIKENGEKTGITFSDTVGFKGTSYKYDNSAGNSTDLLVSEIITKYKLEEKPLSEEEYQNAIDELFN